MFSIVLWWMFVIFQYAKLYVGDCKRLELFVSIIKKKWGSLSLCRSPTTLEFDLKTKHSSVFRSKEINVCKLQPNLVKLNALSN